MKLSIIIPYVNEYPQVIFTIQSIAQSLVDRLDFEIIAIDNYCEDFKNQFEEGIKKVSSKMPDDPSIKRWVEDEINKVKKGTESVKACQRHNKWLRYENYTEKLSHWQAKNLGVQVSSGDILWFCDSHCVVSRDAVYNMVQDYMENYERYDGTLHLPLTYKILESRKLIYKPVLNFDTAEIHYSFTPYRPPCEGPFEVACMSTCGMMISREIFDLVGQWPRELGIYGGGENFMNFTLSVLGKRKWIYPNGTLFHHGDSRGYHWFYDDHVRNKMIAMYIYGGQALVRKFSKNTKGRPEALKKICADVINKCSDHRAYIKSKQVTSIEEWAKNWVN
jgi:glycosyltransferase involved in cell wall biosynthesis